MEPAINRESRVAEVASWVTLVASFVLSFTTWWALGGVGGYDVQLASGYTIYLSWALALCVDGYIVTALVTWLSPVSERVAKFARWNMYGAAGIGVVAQSAFHAASVWDATHTGWKATLAGGVGALPPLFAALSVHLRVMVMHATRQQPTPVVEVPTPHVPAEQAPAAVSTPAPHPVVSTPPRPLPIPPAGRPVPAPAPVRTPSARKPKTPRAELTPELLAKVRAWRVERMQEGLPVGRRPMAEDPELNISDGLARKVLHALAGEIHQLRATGTE